MILVIRKDLDTNTLVYSMFTTKKKQKQLKKKLLKNVTKRRLKNINYC